MAAGVLAKTVQAKAFTVGGDIVSERGGTSGHTRRAAAAGARVGARDEASGRRQWGRLRAFPKKDEDKPKPPPPKTMAPPDTTAATPCVPKFKSLKAEITGSVGVREVKGRCELILGELGKANGTTFTSKVDVPAGCTGELQYVQLVNMCRTMHLTSGKDIRRKPAEIG